MESKETSDWREGKEMRMIRTCDGGRNTRGKECEEMKVWRGRKRMRC